MSYALATERCDLLLIIISLMAATIKSTLIDFFFDSVFNTWHIGWKITKFGKKCRKYFWNSTKHSKDLQILCQTHVKYDSGRNLTYLPCFTSPHLMCFVSPHLQLFHYCLRITNTSNAFAPNLFYVKSLIIADCFVCTYLFDSPGNMKVSPKYEY